ncbi:hypothetical_protein [Leishmania major strain Friedlin]|nr:hypothetical_protein [Leishmania major strain Friedlin]
MTKVCHIAAESRLYCRHLCYHEMHVNLHVDSGYVRLTAAAVCSLVKASHTLGGIDAYDYDTMLRTFAHPAASDALELHTT